MWKKLILGTLIALISLYVMFHIAYVATSVPFFCAKCHEVEKYVSSWQASVHKTIGCLDCHQPRGELGKFHAKARGLNYVFQHYSKMYTIPSRAIISEQNCIGCHLGDNAAYPDTIHLKNTPEINHYQTIKQSKSCLECHRESGHKVDIYLTPELKGAKS